MEHGGCGSRARCLGGANAARCKCLVHSRCEWLAGAAVAPYSDVPLTVARVQRRCITPTKLQKTSGERYKVRRQE
eukprot:scaffold90850_cov69-Phaeocystis_antarctica.AAC.4